MVLKMQLIGSMGDEAVEFSGKEHGHAHAINEAIAYLTNLQIRAINTDHDVRDCKEEGPTKGWCKGDDVVRGSRKNKKTK
jgi:hypothetical protein